jgi:hypothetical protein
MTSQASGHLHSSVKRARSISWRWDDVMRGRSWVVNTDLGEVLEKRNQCPELKPDAIYQVRLGNAQAGRLWSEKCTIHFQLADIIADNDHQIFGS